MDMHLVGGFLGSGKTTSIINAVKILIVQGIKVGVVTNDKGRHLVDTAFFRSADIPTAEVAGGCFRCNYDQLEERLHELEEKNQPDVIFAESVGSCADMAETVMKPLLEYQAKVEGKASFSVFCDIRLLRFWLLGAELPFADDVVYIFEQQLEEAPLIVINKSDMFSDAACQEVVSLAQKRFPQKQLLLQSALRDGGTQPWLDIVTGMNFKLPGEKDKIKIDYEMYDSGSQKLAWLDESITLIGNRNSESVKLFVKKLLNAIHADDLTIGHVKFFCDDGENEIKISFPTLTQKGWDKGIPENIGKQVKVLLNGRLECTPAKISRLVRDALDATAKETGVMYTREESAYFRPRVSPTLNSHMI